MNVKRSHSTERNEKFHSMALRITVPNLNVKKKEKKIKTILTMGKSILNPTTINGPHSDDFCLINSLCLLKKT